MGFEGDKIAPITFDRGGRHVGQIVAAAMHIVRQQKAEDASFQPKAACCVNLLLRVVAAKVRPCTVTYLSGVITHGIEKAVCSIIRLRLHVCYFSTLIAL